MSLYSAALMTTKKFVKVFQQEEQAVYRIHTEQLNVFMEFKLNVFMEIRTEHNLNFLMQ